jgi:hypothetical protein
MGIERSITHWTAGGGRASDLDKKHYHRITERDGTVVNGTEAIEDNIVTGDGDYAAHVRNLNTGSAGFAMAGMREAKEFPFDPGPSPITRAQFEAHCKMVAEFHMDYGIPVTRRTCLTHAEVEPTLGVKQRGKWDFTRIPFEPGIVGAIPCGDYFRERVNAYLDDEFKTNARPTLREGDRGPMVSEVQTLMAEDGVFSGKIDGKFGPRTKAAVMDYQSRAGLHPDGVVGPNTWRALMQGIVVEPREVTEDDLRQSGSNTIKIADEGENRAKQGAGAVVGLGAVDTALETADKVAEAQGTLETVQGVLADNWPVLLLMGVGIIAFFYGPNLMKKLRAIRTLDAKTGANLKR